MVEVSGDERDVEIAGLADRLAVVQAFEHREQPRVLLDGARQRVEMTRPGMSGQRRPRAERVARGGHRGIYLRRRSEEHTSELQSQSNLVCRLLLEKKKEVARMSCMCKTASYTYNGSSAN